jgi:hypothetical protein
MLFYIVGRSYLLELYHSDLQSGQVRIVDGRQPDARMSTLWRL